MRKEATEALDHIIYFETGINLQTAEMVRRAIQEMITIYEAKTVHLALNTPGGGVNAGTALHNYLRASPVELITHNVGDIDSIGNVVFVAGEKRYATPNSRFLLHGVTTGFRAGGDGVARLGERELMEGLERVRQDQDRIAQTIMRYSKFQLEELRALFRGDNILTPEQACEKGLVHEVRDFVIPEGANVLRICDIKEKE